MKIIIVAYDLNQKLGSEAGRASIWVQSLDNKLSVEVYTRAVHQKDILESISMYGNVQFHFVENSGWSLYAAKNYKLYFLAMREFFKKVRKEISTRQDLSKIGFIHCLTPAGVYMYNDLYRFGVPIYVGPLGGGLDTPRVFQKKVNEGGIRQVLRDLYYRRVIRKQGWKNYFLNASRVFLGLSVPEQLIPRSTHATVMRVSDAIVDTDYFCPAPEIKKEGENLTILFVGRLTVTKGITFFVDAAKLVVEGGNRNISFKIAGDGPLKSKVQRMIASYNLTGFVEILGVLDKASLVEVYRKSDIFCLPTIREPGGTSILEAMACGIPVISTDYGGPSITIDDSVGIKIKPQLENDFINSLAKAMNELIDNGEKRHLMGEHARQKVVEKYSKRSVARIIREAYGVD